jgi:hypothetical protein
MQNTHIRWLLLLGLLFSTIAPAQTAPLMPLDDIRPGMMGIGKTVFSGTTIEEFDVEILAVLENDGQPGDAIMAKISGGSLPIEEVGIIAGMSGSPIYIDGKLIGALAFGQAFSKEPMIVGITPIHEMLADASRGNNAGNVATAWSMTSPAGSWWSPVPSNRCIRSKQSPDPPDAGRTFAVRHASGAGRFINKSHASRTVSRA